MVYPLFNILDENIEDNDEISGKRSTKVTTEGTTEVTTKGTTQETAEETFEGTSEGTPEGTTPDGTAEETSEGTAQGSAEGSTEESGEESSEASGKENSDGEGRSSAFGGRTRNIEFKNNCGETIWVGAQGNPLPFGGGFQLDAGQSSTQSIPGNTEAGRFWARTGCSNQNSRFICQTGDCGSAANNFAMKCGGIGGQPPASLAEFTFSDGGNNHDYYDLSNVDGFNVGIKMEPRGGSKVQGAPNDQYNCGSPSCAMDLGRCPPELKMNKNGRTVCASICAAMHNAEQRAKFSLLQNLFNDPDKRALVCCECLCPPNVGPCNCENAASKYCCSPYNLPSPKENGGKCRVEEWPLSSAGGRYDSVFKDACPDSYSWQFDDHKSTYICNGADYKITFCP